MTTESGYLLLLHVSRKQVLSKKNSSELKANYALIACAMTIPLLAGQ